MMMGQGLRPVKVLFRQIIHLFVLIFVIDIPILILLIYLIKKENVYKSSNKFRHSNPRTTSEKILVSALIMVILSAQIIITNFTLDNRKPSTLYTQTIPGFVNTYGLFPLYAYELHFTIFGKDDSSIVDELDTEFDEKGILDNDVILLYFK